MILTLIVVLSLLFVATHLGLSHGAILRGRNRLAVDELSFPLAVIGIAIFAALAFFHGRFFGGELF